MLKHDEIFMKLFITIFLSLAISRYSFSQYDSAVQIHHLEIPQLKPNEYVISHLAYSLSYNELNEQANWVAYELTNEETNSIFKRNNKFIVDPQVKTESANNNDYLASGFDRGHLAPAGDMEWSATAMEESFYYSNMSPQEPSFNRGVWKRAEELVRNWAIEYKSIYIVTGPVLSDNLPTIGPNKVSIPKYYYKVILDYHKGFVKGVGFVIPNTGSKELLETFAISIDSVEKVTGINFFPLLPDLQEKIIERNFNIESWNWSHSKQLYEDGNESCNQIISDLNEHKVNVNNEHLKEKPVKHEVENVSSVQCSGTTTTGARCKNRTKNSSGRCHLH